MDNNKKSKILFFITIIIIIIVIIGAFVIRKFNKSKEVANSTILDNIVKIKVYYGNSSISTGYEIFSNGKLNYNYFNCGKKLDGNIELSNEEFKNVLNLIEKYNVLFWYNNSKYLSHEKEALQMDGGDFKYINFEFNEKVNIKTSNVYSDNNVEKFFIDLIKFVDSKTNHDVYNI